MVTIRAPADDSDYDARVTEALEQAIANERENFVEIFQIGPSRINSELKQSLFEDLKFLGPLSAALLSLTILLFLGSFFGALLPLVSAALSLIWTFGLMGHLDIPVNILSAMLPSLVIVIGATEDTHMLSAYFHGLHQAGDNPPRRRATRFDVVTDRDRSRLAPTCRLVRGAPRIVPRLRGSCGRPSSVIAMCARGDHRVGPIPRRLPEKPAHPSRPRAGRPETRRRRCPRWSRTEPPGSVR